MNTKFNKTKFDKTKLNRRKNNKTRTVTILFTKYSDLFGRFVCGISKNAYSHASISIDDNEEIFYSFNYKGFVIEKPKKYMPKKRLPGSICIRIHVTERTYEKLKNNINKFIENKELYGYSRWGVVLCLLGIPHKFENHYFCSQFIAELLSGAGVLELNKQASLYTPSHLIDMMECLSQQTQIMHNLI